MKLFPTRECPTCSPGVLRRTILSKDNAGGRKEAACRQTGGNVSVAAKSLGVSRPMAYRLMKRLPDLDPEGIRVSKLEN